MHGLASQMDGRQKPTPLQIELKSVLLPLPEGWHKQALQYPSILVARSAFKQLRLSN